MSLFTHGFVLTAALGAGPVLALAQARPTAGELMFVVAPFADNQTLVRISGGRLIGPEIRFPGSLAVSGDPAFQEVLKSNGAWFVFDGRRIARFCGVSP